MTNYFIMYGQYLSVLFFIITVVWVFRSWQLRIKHRLQERKDWVDYCRRKGGMTFDRLGRRCDALSKGI